jgi:hypothetical protein
LSGRPPCWQRAGKECDEQQPGSGYSSTAARPQYCTYVHGTKWTALGNSRGAVHERLILGKVGDERFAVAQFDGNDRIIGAAPRLTSLPPPSSPTRFWPGWY